MTIRLLATYRGFKPNTIVTLATATENALVAGGNATTDLSGGVPFDYQLPAPTIVTPKLAIGRDGVAIALVDSAGKIVSTFTGISAPGAPTGLALTAIAGGVLATMTAPASTGGTPIIGYEVTLSTGQVQLGETTTITVNAPAGTPVTATAKAINGYDKSVASAVSNSVTPTGVVVPVAPAVLSAPAITGTPTVGTPLTITAATFSGTPTPNITRTIRMDGVQVASGNQSTTYTPVAGDVGKIPSVTATATNSAGTASTTGAGAAVVAGGTVDQTYEVVVYGATLPGLTAAMAAKKQGKSVAVFTERNDIGGMVTAGIQLTDVYNTTRAVLPKGSLTDQLYARIANVQSKTQQQSFFQFSYAAESKRALADINVMLTNAGITVVQNAPLTAATMIGSNMDTATFGTTKVRAKVWVDGSYTSDLYARTGGDYIIGAEAAATYSEGPQAGGFRTTGIQPAVNIDPYIVPGDSSSGLIKYVNPADASAEGAAVLNKVQFGGYRLSITNVAGQFIPFTAPSNYVASDFELHRRWFTANGQSLTTLDQVLNLQTSFPAIPSSTSGMTNKRDANNRNFVSLDYPDVADNIRIATPGIPLSEKLAIEERAKQYTLGLLYFYQNDPSVPSALRADAATWGFCNDDYAATGRFPPRFYIREGLRALGDTTPMAGPQMVAQNSYTNPIAFNYYAFDAHNRQFIDRGGRVIQEGASPTSIATAPMSRVPMNLLFGKKAQASNVLLTWGGAESRIAYCATRVEPLMGVIGEAAGIVAALAVTNNTAVQDVPYSQLAPIQNLFGNNVPGGCVISADGVTWTDGTVTLSGYTLSTLSPPTVYGTAQFAACSATSGTNYIEYVPNLPAAGQYRVEVKYIDTTPTARGTQTWTVTAGGVDQTPTAITQTGGINFCGDWQSLGVFTFGAGQSAANKARGVHGNTAAGTNGIAIRFTPVP